MPTELREALVVAIAELFVHGRDMAAATGRRVDDGDIATALLTSDYAALCDQVRHDPSSPFAAAVPTDKGAYPVERLVAFLGRDPAFASGRAPG